MPKIIEVKFMQHQDADELYISTGLFKKVYCRSASSDDSRVVWATTKKHESGYESNSPVKADITFRVVMGKKENKVILFEETTEADASGAVTAGKQERFTSDQLKTAVAELRQKLSLHTYEDWAKWLLKDCAKHSYTGYQDNWLNFGTVPEETTQVETLEIIGQTYTVALTQWRHMVCDKIWKVVEIRDAKSNVMELCGYSYDA